MANKIPIYSAQLTDSDDTGIFAMSFVDEPANESKFIALSKRAPKKLAMKLDKQKQVLTGVVLIPEQLIYRNDGQMGTREYFVKFSAESIEHVANRMMREGVALKNTTHQHAEYLQGNYLTELWIVADSKTDKSVALGLGELPVGTLCASYKVVDAKYWQSEVLTGNVQGFSLEGYFNFKNVLSMSKKTKPAGTPAKKKSNPAELLLKAFSAMFEADSSAEAEDLADEADKDEADAGKPFLIFDLADGSELWVDSEGFATIDDETAPAGEHALADGNVIVIDADGKLVETAEEGEGEEPEVSEVDLAKARGRAKTNLSKYQKPVSAKDKKIANLQKQIDELKKSPSTEKKKASFSTTGGTFSDTPTGKMAQTIANQRKNRK